MGDGESGLQQDQTLGGLHALGAPRQGLVGQGQVIGFRIVAAQRQLEAVLSRGGAMTGTGVASHLRQHGLHVVAKTPHRRER